LVKRALAAAAEDYDVAEACSQEELERKLARADFDLVISDYNILGLDGLEVLGVVKERRPATPVILLTGTGSEEVAVAALKHGAADYVVKSVNHIKKLPATVAAVLERAALARERTRLAARLRASEEKYRSLVESAAEARMGGAADRGVTFFSRGAEQMFGYRAGEVITKPLSVLAPPGRREAFEKELERFITDDDGAREGPIMTFVLARKSGEQFPAELSLSPYAGDGAGFTAIVRDVTEKRRLEEEVARLDRLAAVGEMTAGIAHEVRNPLAAIATSAAVARRELADATLATESVEWILEGVRKIEGLLKRFFDFARPLRLERQKYDINKVIEEVLAAAAERLAGGGARLELELAAELPPAFVDPALMAAVFENVVTNARQAMPEGGVLRVRSEVVGDDGAAVRVTFADTGPGISAEVAGRVLDPFFTTKADGVGLGLPLCYKIVKAHGGDFALLSGDDGAEVVITVPAAER